MEPSPPFPDCDLAHLRAITDQTKRGLYLLALISEHLAIPKPVIVGGFAVEFYSAGGYRTADIDCLFLQPARAGALLEAIGFRKVNRHWVSDELDLQVEFPGHAIEARATPRLTTVTVDGKPVVLIGIEDLILDRLNVAVHAQSRDDLGWAQELILLYRDRLDLEYLREQAVVDRTAEALQQALAGLP